MFYRPLSKRALLDAAHRSTIPLISKCLLLGCLKYSGCCDGNHPVNRSYYEQESVKVLLALCDDVEKEQGDLSLLMSCRRDAAYRQQQVRLVSFTFDLFFCYFRSSCR